MRELTDSGCPWIGKIPVNWNNSKIKFEYEVTLGKMVQPKQEHANDTLENYLCAANIKWDGIDESVHKQMWLSEKEKEQYLLHKGDILVTEGGSIGVSSVYNGEFEPCYFQNSANRLRSKKGNNTKFGYYWMNVVVNGGYIDSVCNKATISHYTKDKLSETPILAIPISEQNAIVTYLDEKCAAIDESIQKRKEIIEKLQEYRKAVITQAVFDPTRTNAETIKLKYIFDIVAGATPKSDIESFWDGSISWVTPADYKSDDKYVSHGAKTITDAGYESCSTTLVPKGSLVVSKRAPVGTVAIAANELCTNQGCLSCIPRKDINSEFYYYVLYSMTEHMKILASGTTFQEISQTSFMNMKVPYCNKAVQDAIVISLNEKCVKIGEMLSKQQAIIDKLEEYKKSIIYNAVTGKIDCRPS